MSLERGFRQNGPKRTKAYKSDLVKGLDILVMNMFANDNVIVVSDLISLSPQYLACKLIRSINAL